MKIKLILKEKTLSLSNEKNRYTRTTQLELGQIKQMEFDETSACIIFREDIVKFGNDFIKSQKKGLQRLNLFSQIKVTIIVAANYNDDILIRSFYDYSKSILTATAVCCYAESESGNLNAKNILEVKHIENKEYLNSKFLKTGNSKYYLQSNIFIR